MKPHSEINRKQFGDDFIWGVATSAYQIEGAWNLDGKGRSIWDQFTHLKNKIYNNDNGDQACDYYHRWKRDINLMQFMGIENFRFSLSWSRILPNGTGSVNRKGIDFYDRIIDYCLESEIQPWLTLYHWDLPQALEKKGGWTNRDIIDCFLEYTELCVEKFGDRVKYWMVLNEPMVFTGAGYFLGIHAPGKKGLKNFIPAIHHAAICQAEGGRLIKEKIPSAQVGTTFSCSHIDPFRANSRDQLAAQKVDALLNRLFIEPALGLGYPLDVLKPLQRIENYMKAKDEKRLSFEFDFIGIQNYTREVVKHSIFTPLIYANVVNAEKRNVPVTSMNWEVYPESIYQVLKKFNEYPNVKRIIITENGAAFPDVLNNGRVEDKKRLHYLKSHIYQVLRAKKEEVPVEGYFIWSFLDNFEWAEGYDPRFGIVYVKYSNQERIIKDSGLWYKSFLSN